MKVTVHIKNKTATLEVDPEGDQTLYWLSYAAVHLIDGIQSTWQVTKVTIANESRPLDDTVKDSIDSTGNVFVEVK